MPAKEDKYGKGHQQNLITILAHDPVHGKIVARLIKPELFTGDWRHFAEVLRQYWIDFNAPPGIEHTADLFTDVLNDPDNRKAETYRKILSSMNALIEGINVKYVLRELKTQHRKAEIQNAILRGAEILEAQQGAGLNETEEILADLLRAREIEFDPGINLLEVDLVVDYVESHYSEFRTGIELFDQRNVVPARQEVLLLLAPTGYGKTWFMIHVGKHALMQRKKVVHITMEMGAELIAQRYYQSLFSIPKKREDIEIPTLELDENGRLIVVGAPNILKPKRVFMEGNIRKVLKRQLKPAMAHRMAEDIRIKRFPPRMLTTNHLRAYLDTIEAQGFTPDMICLDYIGVMKTDVKNHRIELGRIMEDFRALMIERNTAGITAQQVGRAGMEATIVKPTHVAEDISLISTSDVSMTFSRTFAEERAGLARLFVDKARNEQDKFGVVLTQSYKLGQFVLQSAPLDKKYGDYLDKLLGIERKKKRDGADETEGDKGEGDDE